MLMLNRDRPIYRVVFLFVLAPVGAAVIIVMLLVLGAEPHSVFIVGHAVKSSLMRLGVNAPNSVGVLSTVFVWWLVIVMMGLAWERVRRRKAT